MHGAPPEYGRPRDPPAPPHEMRLGGQARAVPSSEGFNPDRLEGGVCPTCGARGEEEKDRQKSASPSGGADRARQLGGRSVGHPTGGGVAETQKDNRQELDLTSLGSDWSKEGKEEAQAVGRMLVWMWRGAVAVVLALVGLHFARMDLDTLALLLDSRLQVLPEMLHPAPCTLHPALCTRHPAPCTLHPAPSTLNPQPSTLHSRPQTSAAQPCDLVLHRVDQASPE